jgi:acyl-CoA thioesterase
MAPLDEHLQEGLSMDEETYLKELKRTVNSCPYYRLLGMEITKIRAGESIIRMPFKQDLTHPYGIVHGGAIASLADSAVVIALVGLVESKDRITTIEFKINFFAPVDGGELKAHAKIIHKGSKTAVGDVEVINEEGKRVAKVVATY